MIRVGDLLGQIGDALGQIALAIRAAAAVTVAAGIAVLVGAVAASARARRYDAVILKLLGGSRASGARRAGAGICAAFAASLVLVAIAVGGAGGWYVVVKVFALPFAPDWSVVAATLATATAMTLGIGVLGSLPALAARPAAGLREM